MKNWITLAKTEMLPFVLKCLKRIIIHNFSKSKKRLKQPWTQIERTKDDVIKSTEHITFGINLERSSLPNLHCLKIPSFYKFSWNAFDISCHLVKTVCINLCLCSSFGNFVKYFFNANLRIREREIYFWSYSFLRMFLPFVSEKWNGQREKFHNWYDKYSRWRAYIIV